MADIALVHGSFHGAWCWERVTPLLTAAGHRVHTPDLDGGRKSAADVLSELDGPAILVGHSSGGMLISALARLAPESATALVYLSGFLLAPGRTPHDLGGGRGSLFDRALVVDREAGTMAIRPELAGELFYHDCDPADAARATARLTPEALRRGASGPAEESEVDSTRFYVECLDDRALDPAKQRRMYTETPVEAVYSLDSGHSPFLSRPTELAGVLDAIARSR
ncbi:alpha/beta fold hydrolase [Phytomonospora endophytica]|uniref:Pimeloyl-ACP methyl ester carboxylesterase n=1 Tax=Phytomonospora endophytica TaxID=714109 RepID=A0A841FJS9_9ACTN|nr:alpha/beta fold hydrolase [Phytomonospora endophytica]MBB6036134.1 pimeloyl-ACP methyl ester carboxylesterase [Phytomonospora endophytica]GIG67037.1 hypothetical protein Pen01_33320 [Phytomonospora endophytica]